MPKQPNSLLEAKLPRARLRFPGGRRFQDVRAGASLLSAVFWAFGLVVMCLPFMRARSRADTVGDDPKRKLSELDIPFAEDVANFDADTKLNLAAALKEASSKWFGEDSEHLAQSGLIQLERLAPGKFAYTRYCAGCHAGNGDGGGSAATHLEPRPRNFRKGVFKFTSTASGKPPLRRDLFQVITRGLSGSSMPNFRLLNEERRHDIVEYVRYLAVRGSFEQMMLDAAWDEQAIPKAEELASIVTKRWSEANAAPVFPSMSEPPKTPETIARGKELFLSATGANCVSCHGPGGRGDGPSATEFKDDWGYPIRPRDLTVGVFRAGSESADLYRSIDTGVKGTPMPSYGSSIEAKDIWCLVHFVQSLKSN